ncbi:hypothetical protein HUJ04_008260 [Dendroctonus ponderosae]|nr:hypothetical protein HUJ04_008260 [Dendroctonus ponderosae]
MACLSREFPINKERRQRSNKHKALKLQADSPRVGHRVVKQSQQGCHFNEQFNADRLSAVFFDHDRSSSYETATFTRRIRGIFKHNSYGNGGNYNNDIALLKLDQDVSLDAMTRPVCLPSTGKSFTGLNGIYNPWLDLPNGGYSSRSGSLYA